MDFFAESCEKLLQINDIIQAYVILCYNRYSLGFLFTQDSQTLRAEADDKHRKWSYVQKENHKHQQAIQDLSNQVMNIDMRSIQN